MASGLCAPHKQAAHMAAPTEGQSIKKALANGEPSTHVATRTLSGPKWMAASDPKQFERTNGQNSNAVLFRSNASFAVVLLTLVQNIRQVISVHAGRK